jgi:hypothetical protein
LAVTFGPMFFRNSIERACIDCSRLGTMEFLDKPALLSVWFCRLRGMRKERVAYWYFLALTSPKLLDCGEDLRMAYLNCEKEDGDIERQD